MAELDGKCSWGQRAETYMFQHTEHTGSCTLNIQVASKFHTTQPNTIQLRPYYTTIQVQDNKPYRLKTLNHRTPTYSRT
jgi:hypothetical protein